MKKIKALIVALVLGAAGMVYAAGNMQATIQTQDKGKASSCCCMSTDSCDMKAHEGHEPHNSQAAMECCEMAKDGKDCCASMTNHGEASAKHQDSSCCKAHHDGNAGDDKQSCQMSKKDGDAGCCSCCGHDAACRKAKTAKG